MKVDLEILLGLMSDQDREKLKQVLSIVSDVHLDQFKNEYIEALKPLHSAAYIRSIDYSLNQLIKFTGNIPLSKLDVRMIERFLLETYKRSPAAAAHILKTLKAAMNKAKLWNYVSENLFTKIKLPKMQIDKPKIINAEELEIILSQQKMETSDVQNDSGKKCDIIPDSLKDIYRFAFHTGMRAGEFLNLTWRNINLKDRIIKVGDDKFKTKGRKIRYIPINDDVFRIIQSRILKVTRLDGYLFDKRNGNSQFSKVRKDQRYSVDYISKKFKRAVRAAGLDDKIHLHTLRHSFASSLVNSGVDLYVVKELLGHSSINTTQIYSHLNMESLRTAVNRLSVVESGAQL